MGAADRTEFPAIEISFEELRRGTARLVMTQGIDIHGVVVDYMGNAVAGAIVSEATKWGNLKVHSTNVTDALGRFHLASRPQREFIFSASKEGYGSASVIAAVHPGMSPVRIQLPPELPLRGRVINDSGQPQTGTDVRVADYLDEGLGFVWSGTTDAEGRFVWRGAPTNELEFAVGGVGGFKIVRMEASTNEHLITIGNSKSAVDISAKVFDAETHAPIEKFTVSTCYTELGASGGDFARPVKGQAGAFGLKIPFSDFEPGQMPVWTLKVEADGYRPCLSRSFGFDEGDQDLEFALQRVVTLRGTVTTPEGNAATMATVSFVVSHHALFSSNPGQILQPYLPSTITDKNGVFRIREPLDATGIGISHPAGWSIQSLPTNTSELVIQLQRWGRIEGSVLRAGVPMTNKIVALQKLMWDLADPLNIHYQTTTDADGHFVFEKMPAGEFELSVESDEWKDSQGSYVRTMQTPVTVRSGETATATIESAGTSVLMSLQTPAELNGANFANAVATISLNISLPPQPPRDNYVTKQSHHAARLAYARDPFVLAAKRQMRTFGGNVSSEGVVRFDDIPPGSYVFEVTLFRKL
jgi:hypothetical protein